MQPRQDVEGSRRPDLLRLPAVEAVGRSEGPVTPQLAQEEVTGWSSWVTLTRVALHWLLT